MLWHLFIAKIFCMTALRIWCVVYYVMAPFHCQDILYDCIEDLVCSLLCYGTFSLPRYFV